MQTYDDHRASTVRAAALTVIALIAAALTWRLRPSPPTAAASPDADIVLGCVWLAWALAGYLALAVAATALAHVVTAFGVAAETLTGIAPAGLRRLVDTAVTLSVATAILGTTASTSTPAGAATSDHVARAGAPRPAAPSGALDWPGLTYAARPVIHQRHQARPTAPADVGLVTGGRKTPPKAAHSSDDVVHTGDSLWTIAARHLGPDASSAAITAAWHEWYAANRHIVGGNPNLIHPGQRLSPPGPETAPTQQRGSTR
jgi:nucleoid-associated protein YgaU